MSAVDPLVGTSIGSYKISTRIGVGGMGAVYVAEHPLIGKRVAIKLLHAEFADKQDIVQRFFQEARAVSQLKHPNIVDCIDFGRIDSPEGQLHYCIMEFLEGETLRDRVKRGPLSEGDAARIAVQIADAAGSAHRQQIVHRDLKPENVFLTGPDRESVKILDFGIAKLTGQGQASMQTQAGTLLGTPSYMSPEQCMARPVDARTDVYALGIILFEMLAGRVPFIGEGYADLLIKQITGETPPLREINPNVTPAMEAIVRKALEKGPESRFQSMDELQTALTPAARRPTGQQPVFDAPGPHGHNDATLLSDGGPPTLQAQAPDARAIRHSASQRTVPDSPRRSSGLVIGLVIAVLLLGGGAAAWLLLADDKPGPTTPVTGGAGEATTGEGDPAAKKVMHLKVTSDPSPATVKRDDGSELGTTPLDVDLPADGSMVKLTIHKDGYVDEVRAIILSDRDRSLSLQLVRIGEAPVKPEEGRPTKIVKPVKPTRPSSRPSRPRSNNNELLAPKL